MSCLQDISRKSNFAVIVVTLQNYYVWRDSYLGVALDFG